MATRTYDGVIENGQIKLSQPLDFAEHEKVVVTVSDQRVDPRAEIVLPEKKGPFRIPTARFPNPEEARRHMVKVEDSPKNA